MTLGAVAFCFRPGEVRLSEVLSQIGDADDFIARVVNHGGMERDVQVGFTEKWASRGWHRQLRCHGCSGPARILQQVGTAALCRRCRPELTAYHLHKRAGSWPFEGSLADEISRALLRGTSSKGVSSKTKRLATQLKRNSFQRAASVLEVAESLVRAVDNAGVLEP
jgi:hypothetical protein